MKKIWLFYWWIWNESDISCLSALNIEKNIDKEKFQLIPIFWSKDWCFYLCDNVEQKDNWTKINIENFSDFFDVAFLITHWKYGEDGVLQAILESQKIKYCGCGVLSSSLCMDKWAFKCFCQGYDIPQVPFEVLTNDEKLDLEIVNQFFLDFGAPVFVKPANSWSSIGISKITKLDEFKQSYFEARKYDNSIIIEKWLEGHRELEVWVIWNRKLIVSEPWELILTKSFYDFDDKYEKWETKIEIPANISDDIKGKIKYYSEKVYKLCNCRWFSRVDFFLVNDNIYLNEINTLPGFTDISMFPLLMKNIWISYTELISKIIELADDL